MAKILISWIATNNDFTDGRMPINQSGPNCIVHQHYWEYDYHLLLTQAKKVEDDIKALQLASYLKKTYNHQLETVAMEINDVIDVPEICSRINALLIGLKQNEIDIFISPGTPAMQVAWYFAHEKLSLKTKLFQVRPTEHTKTKDKPEQVWITLEQSKIPTALLIREELKDKPIISKFLITKSIQPVYTLAKKVAAADKVTVLILGDTGTGKEGLARYIHDNSPRAKSPFIAVNCAAFGESLLESRLFGYVKGAFTGAGNEAKGFFEEADSGTIFLDEIGDITPYMQQSLLRVLQEKEISRIGEAKVRKVNVRVIAATNKNLSQLCSEGKFRWDLFYRLSVVDLTLPSLVERGIKETEELFDFILNLKSHDFKTTPPKIPTDIRKIIFNYPFPGNIRELENLIERIYATMEDATNENILPKNFLCGEKEHSLKLQDVIVQHVNSVYLMCDKNLVRTAKILDVAPNTVKSKLNLK